MSIFRAFEALLLCSILWCASAQSETISDLSAPLAQGVADISAINEAKHPSCLLDMPPLSNAQTPIVYRDGNLGRPLIGVTINGEHCWFILDSGTSSNVISRTAARRLGIPVSTQASQVGSGHFGQKEQYDFLTSVSATFDGMSPLTGIKAITMDMPAEGFDSQGVCGLISPQSLGFRGTVVLDLPKSKLEFDPHQNATTSALESTYTGFHFNQTTALPSRSDPTGYTNRFFRVPANIEGKAAQTVVVDSGSFISHLPTDYVNPQNTTPGPMIPGPAGLVQMQLANQQTLVLAGERINLPHLGLVPRLPTDDGVIGMDVLRQVIVVIPPAGDTIYFGFSGN